MSYGIDRGTNVVFVDTTSNSGSIILPLTTDQIGRTITFQDSGQNFRINPLTLTTTGADTFDDSTTSRTFICSG